MEEERDEYQDINYTDYKAIWGFGEDRVDIFGDDIEEEEVEDIQTDQEYKIFLCLKCRYILDETKPPHKPRLKDLLEKDGKCPNCGKPIAGNYLAISKEKMKKEQLEKKRKERHAKLKLERELKRTREDIKDDCIDLLEDLRDRLIAGKITPERFVAIYMNAAYRIVHYYNGKLSKGNDLAIYASDYRKAFLSMCDSVLKYYHIQEDATKAINEYDDTIDENTTLAEKLSLQYDGDIEKDQLFVAETKFYLEDDKYALPAYEMGERIAEYEKIQDEIEKAQRQKALEEKYQERVVEYAKKLQERQVRKEERKIY